MSRIPNDQEPEQSPAEDYSLAPSDAASKKAELPVELDLTKEPQDPWADDGEEERFQFSLRDLLGFMVLTAILLSLSVSLPGQRLENFAGVAGLLVLGGGVVLGLIKPQSRGLWLCWWGLLGLYFLATLAAVVVTVVQRLR